MLTSDIIFIFLNAWDRLKLFVSLISFDSKGLTSCRRCCSRRSRDMKTNLQLDGEAGVDCFDEQVDIRERSEITSKISPQCTEIMCSTDK